MITADTITDEQIMSLAAADFAEQDIGDYATPDELKAKAILRFLDGGVTQRIARARCAEILNLRAEADFK